MWGTLFTERWRVAAFVLLTGLLTASVAAITTASAAGPTRLVATGDGVVTVAGGTGEIRFNVHAKGQMPADTSMPAEANGWLRFEATTEINAAPAVVSVSLGHSKWMRSDCRGADSSVFAYSEGFSGSLTVTTAGQTTVDDNVSVHLFVTPDGHVSLSTLRLEEPIDDYTFWVTKAPLQGDYRVAGLTCPV